MAEQREPKFKVGDVVVLKSDDAYKMTIEKAGAYSSISQKTLFEGKYACAWWVNGDIKRAEFPEETLKLAAAQNGD